MANKKAKSTKKPAFTAVELETINHIQEDRGISRKSAIRFLRKNPDLAVLKGSAAPAPAPVVEAPKPGVAAMKMEKAEQTKAPAKTVVKSEPKSPAQVSAARSEGIRLFKLAGRPTKAQFIRVYGKRGHLMTWDQRAAAGVSAEQFQAALAKAGK